MNSPQWRGGEATYQRYGRNYYSEIGRRGGRPRRAPLSGAAGPQEKKAAQSADDSEHLRPESPSAPRCSPRYERLREALGLMLDVMVAWSADAAYTTTPFDYDAGGHAHQLHALHQRVAHDKLRQVAALLKGEGK